MNPHRIQSISIAGLWGRKTLQLPFFPNVTILIGDNGTGKTTILNLLRAILTADRSLFSYNFREAEVELSSFSDGSPKTIKVSRRNEGIVFWLSGEKFTLHPSRQSSADNTWSLLYQTSKEPERQPLDDAIEDLVPFVWLPVSRRLPVPDDKSSERYTFGSKSPRLESVDQRLSDLARELTDYRLRLDSKVSQRYTVFEQKVLEAILYSADYDSMGALQRELPPSQDDQEQLIRVFQEVGILNENMTKRIRAHFVRAEEALSALRDPSEVRIEDLFIVPLIRRTRSLVEWARNLSAEREDIFSSLRRYEEIINSFLSDKHVAVTEDGRLAVSYIGETDPSPLSLDHLSSGEKQILILLTAALLRADVPVVYLADEPELSLHVSWQARLLQSLVDLGGAMQVIVATHSPDVVGPFHDHVVELSR